MLYGAGSTLRADGCSRRLYRDGHTRPGSEWREHTGALQILAACRRCVHHVPDMLGPQGARALHLREPHCSTPSEGGSTTEPPIDVLLQDWQAPRHLE